MTDVKENIIKDFLPHTLRYLSHYIQKLWPIYMCVYVSALGYWIIRETGGHLKLAGKEPPVPKPQHFWSAAVIA